jgi:hypothetical protein
MLIAKMFRRNSDMHRHSLTRLFTLNLQADHHSTYLG